MQEQILPHVFKCMRDSENLYPLLLFWKAPIFVFRDTQTSLTTAVSIPCLVKNVNICDVFIWNVITQSVMYNCFTFELMYIFYFSRAYPVLQDFLDHLGKEALG